MLLDFSSLSFPPLRFIPSQHQLLMRVFPLKISRMNFLYHTHTQPMFIFQLPFQPLHCTIFNTSSITKGKKIDKIINMFADVEFIVQENYVSSNFGNYFYKILLFNDIFHLLLYIILIKWLHVFVSNDNTTYLNMSIIYGRKFIWFISFFIKALVEKKILFLKTILYYTIRGKLNEN